MVDRFLLYNPSVENPYWHDQYKPHLVDRDDIRQLCFEIFAIIRASSTQQGPGVEYDDPDDTPEFTDLDQLFFDMAEAQLSKRLLRLALLVRTFDDTMARSAKGYSKHRKIIDGRDDLGAVHKGSESAVKSIRECSNKIIHAEDVRPTYESEDDKNDPKCQWGMTGSLELEGLQGGKPWQISIYLDAYLEGILDLITFGETFTEPTATE